MESNDRGFLNRRVSICHLLYMAVICIIIMIATLVIIPGRIHDDAYQNFSFAATITSIVLAVVSIVYSLQSGLSNIGQLHTISDIEGKISTEVKKISDIDIRIREIINPLQNQVSDIKDSQDHIIQTQEEIWKELSDPVKFTVKEGSSEKQIEGPAILYVVLYAALLSYEKGMDMPFHKFAEYVGAQAKYCEGLVDGMSVLSSNIIKVEMGSKPTRKRVSQFDVNCLGNKDTLKQKIESIGNTQLSERLLGAIDQYYSIPRNQEPSGCV